MGNGFGEDVWGTSRCELAEELSGGWGGEYWVYFGRLGEETSIFEGYPFPEVEYRLEIRSEDGAHMVHNESLKSAYESDLEIEHCGHPSMRRK